MTTLSTVGRRNDVIRLAPLNRTIIPSVKPVPATPMLRVFDPGITLTGRIPVIVMVGAGGGGGGGGATATGTTTASSSEFEEPLPGVKTVTRRLLAESRSAARSSPRISDEDLYVVVRCSPSTRTCDFEVNPDPRITS